MSDKADDNCRERERGKANEKQKTNGLFALVPILPPIFFPLDELINNAVQIDYTNYVKR